MARSRGAYDLTIDDGYKIHGFNLAHGDIGRNGIARPAVVPVEVGAARADQAAMNADVPRVIDNLDAGMGYSRRLERVPNGYAYTLPGYCRAPGGIFMPSGQLTEITLPPTSGAGSWTPDAIEQTIRFNQRIYLVPQGRHLLSLAPDGNSATVAATFPARIGSGQAAVFNNRLYLATEAGLYYIDAAGVLNGPAAPVQRSILRSVNWRPLGVPTDVLVGATPSYSPDGGSAIRWCPITADPMVDSNWSAPLKVGPDQHYGIQDLVAAPRRIFILRPDGVYDVDELGARAYNIAPWIATTVDFWNGGMGLAFGEGLYYGHSQGLAFVPTNGEAQYRPEWATPGWGLPNESPIRGYPINACLHDGWGLLAQWDPFVSRTFVSAGRRDPGGAAGSMAYGGASHVWHGAEAVVPGRVQAMGVHTTEWAAGYPRLFMATTDEGTPQTIKAYWQSLPKFGTPLQELIWGGGFVPASAASLFLPADPWDRPSAVKTLLELEMTTERLNPGSDYLKAYASGDAGAWADQGRADQGTYTSLAPLETTEGRYISVRVDAIGSPILRSLELRSAVGIQLRESRLYRVILAYDNALKSARSRETADPERRMMDLRGLLGRVCMLDDGEAYGPLRVRVAQVMAGERRRLGGAQRAGANGAEGAWAIVVPILVSILDRPFSWDGPPTTDVYDRDRTWA